MIRKLARLSLLTALGLLAAWLEATLLPSPGVPGVKLGLANLFTVVALYRYGWREAAYVTLARVALSALLFGSLSSLMYAVSGAALAVPGMALCKRARRFSCVGVSIAGGVLHNLGQLGAAVIVAQTPGLSAYLPVLLVAGAVTGLVNGLLADVLIKRFP